MPLKSKAQVRWAHSKSGVKALGGKKAVAEWDAHTNFDSLPERVSDKPKPRMRHYTRPR